MASSTPASRRSPFPKGEGFGFPLGGKLASEARLMRGFLSHRFAVPPPQRGGLGVVRKKNFPSGEGGICEANDGRGMAGSPYYLFHPRFAAVPLPQGGRLRGGQ